jgi:hypothetical protein
MILTDAISLDVSGWLSCNLSLTMKSICRMIKVVFDEVTRVIVPEPKKFD